MSAISDSGDPPEGSPDGLNAGDRDFNMSPAEDFGVGEFATGFLLYLAIYDTWNGPSFSTITGYDGTQYPNYVNTIAAPLNALITLGVGIGTGGSSGNSYVNNPPNNWPYSGFNITGVFFIYGPVTLQTSGVLYPINGNANPNPGNNRPFNGIGITEPAGIFVQSNIFMRAGTWLVGVQLGSQVNSGILTVAGMTVATLTPAGMTGGAGSDPYGRQYTIVVPKGGGYLSLQMNNFQSDYFANQGAMMPPVYPSGEARGGSASVGVDAQFQHP
jgi:hypothetical protein